MSDVRQNLRGLAEIVKARCPDGVGFALLLFVDAGERGLLYVSNCERGDMLTALAEFKDYVVAGKPPETGGAARHGPLPLEVLERTGQEIGDALRTAVPGTGWDFLLALVTFGPNGWFNWQTNVTERAAAVKALETWLARNWA